MSVQFLAALLSSIIQLSVPIDVNDTDLKKVYHKAAMRVVLLFPKIHQSSPSVCLSAVLLENESVARCRGEVQGDMARPFPPLLSFRLLTHFVASEAYRVLSDPVRATGHFILA